MIKKILPSKTIKGCLRVPGDKSISHRALMLAAMAQGESRITGLLQAEDVVNTRKMLEKLGMQSAEKNNALIIQGRGKNGFAAPEDILDAGNSGTGMRLIAGILAAQKFDSVITGDKSLQSRPMTRVIAPLEQMGAEIQSIDGRAPLKINGQVLRPLDYISPVASAQVKSCVLLAGLFAKGTTSVTEPFLSRDHTERMLPCFGVKVIRQGLKTSVQGKARLISCDIDVPGDISSAAFFMAAACLLKPSDLIIKNVGINPARTGILKALQRMGADIKLENHSEINNEPRADILVRHSRLNGITLSGDDIPEIIDELPVLAVLAAKARGKTLVKDARELRVKETDRINAVCVNLRAMGIDIQEHKDGFSITGPQKFSGGVIESFDDHRIAMAFSIAGLIADKEVIIKNSECVHTSFPNFYNLLKEVCHD